MPALGRKQNRQKLHSTRKHPSQRTSHTEHGQKIRNHKKRLSRQTRSRVGRRTRSRRRRKRQTIRSSISCWRTEEQSRLRRPPHRPARRRPPRTHRRTETLATTAPRVQPNRRSGRNLHPRQPQKSNRHNKEGNRA